MNNIVVNHSHTGYGADGRQATVISGAIAATADGDNTVIAAVTGKKIRIFGMMFNSSAGGVSFSMKSGTTVLANAIVPNLTFIDWKCPGGWIFETAAGEAFILNTTAGQDLLGVIIYAIVDA